MIDKEVLEHLKTCAIHYAYKDGPWIVGNDGNEDEDGLYLVISQSESVETKDREVNVAKVFYSEDVNFIAAASPKTIAELIESYEELEKKVNELEKEADWLSKLLAITSPQNASAPVTPQFWRDFAKMYVGSKIGQTEEIDNG